VAELHRNSAELNIDVILISFVGAPSAHRWRNEVGVPQEKYPFLLDLDRKLYRLFGLRSDEQAVWSLSVRFWYLVQKLRGKHLYQIDGDPNQLGGDFLIDSNAVCKMAYRSKDPIDRPTVSQILQVLNNQEKEEGKDHPKECNS